MTSEAPLRESKNGLVTDGDGWFVVNARESRWRDEGSLGSYCTFEGKRRFPQLGINISVFEPGEAMGMYHRERAQEAFLVVAGECTLIVEGTERTLRQWDFFHCAPGTEHIIVTTDSTVGRRASPPARVGAGSVASTTPLTRSPRATVPASPGRRRSRARHTRRSGRISPGRDGCRHQA